MIVEQIEESRYSHWETDICFPRYFRSLSKIAYWEETKLHEDDVIDQFDAVLKKNLLFGREGREAGVGDWEDYFFCAEIEDDDLPWDITEVDW